MYECPCNAGCPNGCPCPNYQCETTIKTTKKKSSSVLILNTYKANNVPVVTDLNGKNDKDISFEIEYGVDVAGSCSVQFKGQFYIYGSYEIRSERQIAKVVNCSLKRVGTLPFEHKEGACAATNNQLFLCFDDQSGNGKTCRVANQPTGPFQAMADSIEHHADIRTAASKGKPTLYKSKNSSF